MFLPIDCDFDHRHAAFYTDRHAVGNHVVDTFFQEGDIGGKTPEGPSLIGRSLPRLYLSMAALSTASFASSVYIAIAVSAFCQPRWRYRYKGLRVFDLPSFFRSSSTAALRALCCLTVAL